MQFRERYGPWAIIAGASEGTGRSFARQTAANGLSCILIANGGPLETVAEEIRAQSDVQCITAFMDLSAPEAFEQIVTATGEREVGLYVANAGTDVHGTSFLDSDVTAWLEIIAVNVLTTTRCCHHFGRLMRARGRGGILLVNSGACYGGGSFLATYTAAKAFQLNLGESLWTELRPLGIDVLSLVLRQTDTPAYHRLQARKGKPSSPNLDSPDDVARTGLERLRFGPVHNMGLADDEMGRMPASASMRRERVLAMDAAIVQLFGKGASLEV